MNYRSSGWIFKVILFNIVVIGVVIILTIVEVVMRRLDLPKFDACVMGSDYSIADPELGFVSVPNGMVGEVKLNKRGLRGSVLPIEKNPGHFRILFIGDSTCWGFGVQLEDTFAAAATRLIAEDNPEHTIEYVIGAFPGYSSYQSRIMLDRLIPMKPDLVVFYVGANNDHTRARYYKDSDIPGRAARLHSSWHQVRLLRAIESVSDKFYRKFLRKLRSYDAKTRVPIREFQENILDMVKKVTEMNAETLILIPPFSDYRLNRHPTIPKYKDSLETIAREFGVPYVRLQEKFKLEDEKLVYYSDLYHFSKLGHKIVAQEIRKIVAREGIVEHRGNLVYKKSLTNLLQTQKLFYQIQ